MTPQKYAIEITKILNELYKSSPDERFPIDVAQVAIDYSRKKFPNDPIVSITGQKFENFEGMLKNINGWNIIYNTAMNKGRVNFTIAHEFGHYLLHRDALNNGIECDEKALRSWGSDANNRENEANIFASYLLMPFDDFRKQIAKQVVTLDLLQKLSCRYNTSITATILKYISQTSDRVVLVLSIDGFIDWSRSSDQALRTNRYFSARNPKSKPIEIPDTSLASTNTTNLSGIYRKSGDWFENVGYTEMNFNIKDRNLTLLILDDDDHPEGYDDRFIRIIR
jgi:Zn-dependent peptidase ImmA (M78 family)